MIRSLSQQHEQASLARVMRIRWPWIANHTVDVSPGEPPLENDDLFDCTATQSEART